MSVLAVRKIAIVTLREYADVLMQTLQSAGVMHIENIADDFHHDVDERIDFSTQRKIRLEKTVNFLKQFLATPTAIPPKSLHDEELFVRAHDLCVQCDDIDQRIDEIKTTIMMLAPFGEWNENADSLREIGLVMKLAQLDDDDLARIKNCAATHVLGRNGKINLVVILVEDENVDVGVATFDPPKKSMPRLRTELGKLESLSADLKAESSRWAYQLRKLEAMLEKTSDEIERLIELKKAKADDRLIGLHGYVLFKNADTLKQSLADHCVALRIEEPSVDDIVPVMLKNPRPLRGFEAIVKNFTGVNYFEKDKTGIVALLFMFFGALCLTDAGYGMLLAITGYVVALKVHRDFGQAFMWTGVVATIVGLLCGQVFGLIFAKDIMLNIPPILSLAVDAMVCFKFSLLVGVMAMTLSNMVAIFQNGLRTHATGCVLVIFGGITLLIKESELFIGQFYDPAFVLDTVAISLFSLGALAWLIFPEPVFGKEKRIANILWMFYSGPLGLVQDVLSHMRLFGIALSGAILAMVINKICALLPFPFGIIFAPVGHFTVFLLSLLSLYIHTNRLIFLEFGTKCMSGGHHYFTPFSRRT